MHKVYGNTEINNERKKATGKLEKYQKANTECKALKQNNDKLQQQITQLNEENQFTTNKCNQLQAQIAETDKQNAPLNKLYQDSLEKIKGKDKLLEEFEVRFEAMHETHAKLNQDIAKKEMQIILNNIK